MGTVELCRLLDCRLLQHQHVDDRILSRCIGCLMVAGVALCVDRIRHSSHVPRHDRSHRRSLSHWVPRCQQSQFRYLGWVMARLQPRSYGSYLVRSAIVDRRTMHHPHDHRHLALVHIP